MEVWSQVILVAALLVFSRRGVFATQEGPYLYNFVLPAFKNLDYDKWSMDYFGGDPCLLPPVACNAQGYVTRLILASFVPHINGTLSPYIRFFPYLQELRLNDNNMTGEVPWEALGELKDLRVLDLSNNSFIGSIKAVGSLPRVTDLRLQNNRLSGTVPAAFKDKTCDPFIGNPNLFCPPDFASSAPSSAATVPEAPPSSSSSIWPIIVGILAGVVCLVLFLAAAWWWWQRRRRHQQQRSTVDEEGLEKDDINDPLHEEILGQLQQLQRFRMEDLRKATSGFSSSLLLGEGGFGLVYRGSLRDGKQVAIKLLKKEKRGSEEAFINEVNAISGAVHRNLLRLEGFCVERGERALVFPFLPHGSVADYLKGGRMRDDKTPLTWKHRRKIVLGIAEGLAYMHTDCTPRLIHCDMKAENVLLTEDNDPVICDFGLSKLVEVDVIPSAARGNRPSAAVRGTLGHLAPELYNTGKWSEKTDVFGFGVLLQGHVATLVDVQIRSHPADCDPLEVQVFLQVALLCLQQSPADRPTMSECVTMLQGTGLACRWQLWHNTGLEDGLQPPDMPCRLLVATLSLTLFVRRYANAKPVAIQSPRDGESPAQSELKALIPRRRLGFYLFAEAGPDKVLDRKPCQYIYVPPFPRGLGNRLVNHVNAFVLALITHRAIITTPWSFVVRRFCNPFNSTTSWTLPWPVHSSFIGVVKNRTLEFKDIVKYHAERGAAAGAGAAGAAGGAAEGAAAGGGGAAGGDGLLELSGEEVAALICNHTVNIHLAG
ncbi:unnamed protein product, partial [Closterium sp. Yama58-4]